MFHKLLFLYTNICKHMLTCALELWFRLRGFQFESFLDIKKNILILKTVLLGTVSNSKRFNSFTVLSHNNIVLLSVLYIYEHGYCVYPGNCLFNRQLLDTPIINLTVCLHRLMARALCTWLLLEVTRRLWRFFWRQELQQQRKIQWGHILYSIQW